MLGRTLTLLTTLPVSTGELQEKMSSNVAMLCSYINKGKAPKEVTGALTDLKDLWHFIKVCRLPWAPLCNISRTVFLFSLLT